MKKILKKITAALLCCALTAGLFSELEARAAQTNQLVDVGIWNFSEDKPSMGNIAMDNNSRALYNSDRNTLQVTTNPVNISGYISAVTAVKYDKTGNGDYSDAEMLSSANIATGTKKDGVNHSLKYMSSFKIKLPDYIKKTGVEFIRIKIIVPYTPMDSMKSASSESSYIESRLRINWGSAQSTELAKLEPSTEISSGTVKNIEILDTVSGISINTDSTVVSRAARLTVTELTTGKEYNMAIKSMGNDSRKISLYDIRLREGATDVVPSGALQLMFPYVGDLSVYRINTAGVKTILRGTATDEGYRVMTTKTGLFAVSGGVKLTLKNKVPDENPAPVKTIADILSEEKKTDTSHVADFIDISGHWAEKSIVRVVEAGLFNGTSGKNFSPEQKMTDGMIINVIYKMAGTPELQQPVEMLGKNTGLSGRWYERAALWAASNNIITASPMFDGNKNVSREEVATYLYRFYCLNHKPEKPNGLDKYSDAATVSSWAKAAVNWANSAGIINGTSPDKLSPSGNATRAQVAAILCHYLDYIK